VPKPNGRADSTTVTAMAAPTDRTSDFVNVRDCKCDPGWQ